MVQIFKHWSRELAFFLLSLTSSKIFLKKKLWNFNLRYWLLFKYKTEAFFIFHQKNMLCFQNQSLTLFEKFKFEFILKFEVKLNLFWPYFKTVTTCFQYNVFHSYTRKISEVKITTLADYANSKNYHVTSEKITMVIVNSATLLVYLTEIFFGNPVSTTGL